MKTYGILTNDIIEQLKQIVSESFVEKPFLVQLIKNIVLYQTKKDKFEFYILVPLCNEVPERHCLHS